MRMIRPITLFAVALLVCVSSIPVFADEGNPTVTDLGSNIYLVDGNQGPIPNLLPAEEVQKIAALQSAPFGSGFQIVSPVSPDDQTVLAVIGASVSFLNIRDGSSVPLQLDIPLIPVSNFVWVNDDTLGAIGLIITGQPFFTVVSIDRQTGVIQISDPIAGDIPVFVSSNLQKALFASLPTDDSESSDEMVVRLPGADDSALHPNDHSLQAPFRARFAKQLAANGRARALVDFAAMFDPLALGGNIVARAGSHLRVVDLESGESRDLMTLAAGYSVSDVSFSQDGSKFSIVTQSLSVDPRRPTFDGALMSEAIYRDVTGNLPPAQNPYFQTNSLTTLDFPSGVVNTMRAADGDGVVYTASSWSTDNQTLLAKVNQPARVKGRSYPQYYPQFQSGSSLRFYNASMKEIRRVERLEISDPNLTAQFLTPDEVLIQSHYRLDQNPYYYNVRSGEFRLIADRAGTFATVVSTNQSREIVFAYSSYTDPVDIYRMKWDGTAFARITWFNEEIRQFSQTKQYPVSFRLRNGSNQSGVLILPANVAFPPKNVPIVVWQEGGPTTPVENNWYALSENPHALLPNFGFGLLVVPLYGRYGVGPAAFNALADQTNYGQVDIDAQAEIVAQMRARGWASKVGIVGCSYGGYFVTQSITRHPTTYDAAHTMCSLVDLFTEWSRGYNSLAPWFEGLPPAFATAEYAKDSPLYNVKNVRTPLLAFHGTNDFLPITVMENFMLQVINNKVPAKMLKFQDADHGFLRSTPPELSKAYELYGAQEQIIWFRTYLR